MKIIYGLKVPWSHLASLQPCILVIFPLCFWCVDNYSMPVSFWCVCEGSFGRLETNLWCTFSTEEWDADQQEVDGLARRRNGRRSVVECMSAKWPSSTACRRSRVCLVCEPVVTHWMLFLSTNLLRYSTQVFRIDIFTILFCLCWYEIILAQLWGTLILKGVLWLRPVKKKTVQPTSFPLVAATVNWVVSDEMRSPSVTWHETAWDEISDVNAA